MEPEKKLREYLGEAGHYLDNALFSLRIASKYYSICNLCSEHADNVVEAVEMWKKLNDRLIEEFSKSDSINNLVKTKERFKQLLEEDNKKRGSHLGGDLLSLWKEVSPFRVLREFRKEIKVRELLRT